jgi:hypothetical protein
MRVRWQVLNWNKNAIQMFKKCGTEIKRGLPLFKVFTQTVNPFYSGQSWYNSYISHYQLLRNIALYLIREKKSCINEKYN